MSHLSLSASFSSTSHVITQIHFFLTNASVHTISHRESNSAPVHIFRRMPPKKNKTVRHQAIRWWWVRLCCMCLHLFISLVSSTYFKMYQFQLEEQAELSDFWHHQTTVTLWLLFRTQTVWRRRCVHGRHAAEEDLFTQTREGVPTWMRNNVKTINSNYNWSVDVLQWGDCVVFIQCPRGLCHSSYIFYLLTTVLFIINCPPLGCFQSW